MIQFKTTKTKKPKISPLQQHPHTRSSSTHLISDSTRFSKTRKRKFQHQPEIYHSGRPTGCGRGFREGVKVLGLAPSIVLFTNTIRVPRVPQRSTGFLYHHALLVVLGWLLLLNDVGLIVRNVFDQSLVGGGKFSKLILYVVVFVEIRDDEIFFSFRKIWMKNKFDVFTEDE